MCLILDSQNRIYNIFWKRFLPIIQEESPNTYVGYVLVMGYPKVSFFLNFCTGEKATISSQAELRMTPTIGAIAAQGEIYYPKGLPSVYLVTAKIRGGNSGGPVINKEGMVVAIATGISAGEGLSDDNIGYGMAYPIQCVETMMSEKNYETFTFVEFPE